MLKLNPESLALFVAQAHPDLHVDQASFRFKQPDQVRVLARHVFTTDLVDNDLLINQVFVAGRRGTDIGQPGDEVGKHPVELVERFFALIEILEELAKNSSCFSECRMLLE